MRATMVPATMTAAFAVALLGASGPYSAMAPMDQYLSDRQSEIALARSAAPASVSGDATILVFTSHGYVTAHDGSNGFTCIVERSWTKSFDDDNFWNAKVRAPVCYNPAASRTVLPYTLFRTKLVVAGTTEAAILKDLQTDIADKQLPPAESGAMAYMMAKNGYIDDHVKAWHPHVMIYAPKSDGADTGESWGADRHGSPIVYDDGHQINPEPWSLFFIPVKHWSDGSPD